MKRFYLPYLYGISTRVKTKVHKLSFIALIIIPNYISASFAMGEWVNCIDFFLAFSALYMIYEIGYIYNDILTIRYEQKPTKWLKGEYQQWLEKNYEIVVATRVLIVAITVLVLHIRGVQNIMFFIGALVLLKVFYAFHNYFRDWRNIITVFLLQFVKYGAVVLLFGNVYTSWYYILINMLLIGGVRTYEYGVDKAFFTGKFTKISVDFRRVIYYAAMLLVSIVVLVVANRWDMTVMSCYMLLYRVLCLIVQGNKYISNDRSKNNINY